MNSRAIQELDLLLQEGHADHPLLVEGLVGLYANHLFRFAWVLFKSETDNESVHRVMPKPDYRIYLEWTAF